MINCSAIGVDTEKDTADRAHDEAGAKSRVHALAIPDICLWIG
jgi:hypothetical protein